VALKAPQKYQTRKSPGGQHVFLSSSSSSSSSSDGLVQISGDSFTMVLAQDSSIFH